MASKATIVNGEERPSPVKRQGENPVSKFSGGVFGQWNEFTRFLSDVRAEMRKVVTPSRKEVQSTTTVVIIAVFLFGLFFFVCDTIFQQGLHALLGRLGGF
jgi:preprotein translocase subunit SecE